MRNLGYKSRKEIIDKVHSLGYKFKFEEVEEIENKQKQAEDLSKEYEEISEESKIEDLDLSVRAFNALKKAGNNTLEDVLNLSEDDLISIRSLGHKSRNEIIDKVHSLGFQFEYEKEDDYIEPSRPMDSFTREDFFGKENEELSTPENAEIQEQDETAGEKENLSIEEVIEKTEEIRKENSEQMKEETETIEDEEEETINSIDWQTREDYEVYFGKEYQIEDEEPEVVEKEVEEQEVKEKEKKIEEPESSRETEANELQDLSEDEQLANLLSKLNERYQVKAKEKQANQAVQVELNQEIERVKNEKISSTQKISKLQAILRKNGAFLQELGELDALEEKIRKEQKEIVRKDREEHELKEKLIKARQAEKAIDEDIEEIKKEVHDSLE